MNMRIQGDGVALPKGVGEGSKTKADDSKDRTEGKKDSVQEKPKGEGAGDAKPPSVASTPPQGESRRKDSEQDDKTDRSLTPPRAVDRDAPPRRAVGKSSIAGPREEKEQDPVARRIDQGLERTPGTTRPGDVNVQESGVAVPKCFGESREGENC